MQIWASTQSGGAPYEVKDKVDITITEYQYTSLITLQAGGYYVINACPRTGSEDTPDEWIDDKYWTDYCVWGTIVTKNLSPPLGDLVPPVITSVVPEPETMSQGNRITIVWSSPTQYDKFLMRVTESGVWTGGTQQGEIDITGFSGSWTVLTYPGNQYTFQVQGGVYAGIFSHYRYSRWGPTVAATAISNLRSLRRYL